MRKEFGFLICGIMVRKLSLWDWSRWVCKKLLIYLMEVEMIKWLFVYRS